LQGSKSFDKILLIVKNTAFCKTESGVFMLESKYKIF